MHEITEDGVNHIESPVREINMMLETESSVNEPNDSDIAPNVSRKELVLRKAHEHLVLPRQKRGKPTFWRR
jgi:hypothetical protein